MNGHPLAAILTRLARDRTDEAAWSELYARLWGTVLAIAYRRTRGDRLAAEDVAQEVFIRLVHHCPFGELQTGDAFLAYVLAVSMNETRRYLARHSSESRRVEFTSETTDEKVQDPSREIEIIELYDQILHRLKPLDREILRLSGTGHSAREIATELKIEVNNAEVRLSRARKMVREYLRINGIIAAM